MGAGRRSAGWVLREEMGRGRAAHFSVSAPRSPRPAGWGDWIFKVLTFFSGPLIRVDFPGEKQKETNILPQGRWHAEQTRALAFCW